VKSINTKIASAAVALIATVGLAACSSSKKDSSSGGSGSAAAGPLTKVKLQLQWVNQAQFAGYIVAKAKGFYTDSGLDVTLLEGGPTVVPQDVLSKGNADYAIAWVPKALQSREAGAKITDVGQVFQKSGTTQVSFKDKNITTAADLKGKKVGNWGFGNEFELFAGLTKADIPVSGVTLVQQQFDMQALLNGDIDAAQAMKYNEYAQVLEATNPKTGKLYTPDDFNIIDWNKEGTAMLQDAIWADTDKLSDPTYQATTVKLLTASYKGWIYCSAHAEECRDIVVKSGSKLGASHQLWQMNEVNKLIWPSTDGIGMVNTTTWDQTITVAKTTKNDKGEVVLKGDPTGLAYTNDYTEKALAALKAAGEDTTGSKFSPITVTLNKGGS
jgi:NitT/TauT family transport system substrate-binding protein